MNPMQRVVALIVFGAPALVGAQGEELMLEGSYKPVAERSSDIRAAIEAAVDDMSFIKRPIASSRLTKTNPAYKRIAIERAGSDVQVTFDMHTVVKSPADGTPTNWKREDGEVFAVSTSWQSERLVQTFKAEDGKRVNTFHLNREGELVLDVKITSDQLPKPLTYSLVYRRIP